MLLDLKVDDLKECNGLEGTCNHANFTDTDRPAGKKVEKDSC